MPGFTVPLGFPYPLAADPLNGPAAIKALADAVDASVTATQVSADAASSPPAVKVTGGPQLILNNTLTTLRFDRVVFDNVGNVDLVANPSIVRPPQNGTYGLLANVTFAANVTGRRTLTVVQDATAFSLDQEQASPTATYPTALQAESLRDLVTTNAMILQVSHTAGVTLNVTSCSFALWRIGP